MSAYKVNAIPPESAYIEETADFWEIQALSEYGIPVSSLSILKIVAKEFDELDNDGINSEEDDYSEKLNGVFEHIQSRVENSGKNYPFQLSKSSITFSGLSSFQDYIYVYLLLCTRFNMKKSKVHGDIDGTLLFEKLCADVGKNYFGDSANSFVFGTANPGNFETKVANLIQQIGEGVGFKNPDINVPTKNDDGIDVVIWKEFADKRKGKLIGFGQCKTGTSWRDHINKLSPNSFCAKWFIESPIYEPLRMVFLADTMNEDYNYYGTQQSYLIFNRFRVLEYAHKGVSDEIETQIKHWVDEAIKVIQK